MPLFYDVLSSIRPNREQVIWMAIVWAVAIGLWAVAGEDRPWKSRRK
jgi:hypothetical protein